MKPLGTIQLSLEDPALQSECPLPLPAVQNFITKLHGAQGGGSPTPQVFSGSPDFSPSFITERFRYGPCRALGVMSRAEERRELKVFPGKSDLGSFSLEIQGGLIYILCSC